MGRPFILHYDDIPDHACVHCRFCGTRIAFINHRCGNISNHTWVFHKVFNVEVPEDKRYYQVRDGTIVADAYCIKCRNLLGCKAVAVPKANFFGEAIFFMSLCKLGPIEEGPNNQDGGTNVQNVDQNGDANEQDMDVDEQDVDVDEQDVGANEQNTNQEEGANEQTDEQDGGANEQTGERGGTNGYLDL